MFSQSIADALQLDNIDDVGDLKEYKKAFTGSATKKIYEAISEIWPPDTDIAAVLERSGGDVAGIYLGDYNRYYIHRAIARHSTYANKIFIVDPFLHPYITSDKYNPILGPEQHRDQTLKNVNLFFSLLPWIDEGLIEVIRTPMDFDRRLSWDSMTRSSAISEIPELRSEIEASVEQIRGRHFERMKRSGMLLKAPNSHLRRIFFESGSGKTEQEFDAFVAYVERQRDEDPDFLEPFTEGKPSSQLSMMSTGGTVEGARLAAQMSGAYLFTDLRARWTLIERDRASQTAGEAAWSPLAKAIEGAKLNFLNNVTLDDALRIRKEGRLNGLRKVMKEAWSHERLEDSYDDQNAINFAENLRGAIDDAEAEWDAIKGELVAHTAAEAAAGALAAGPLVASGQAVWLAGATAVAAVGTALYAKWRGSAFSKRFPAAFFMRLDD